ncbi:MAG: iron ABC transporter permease [Muribaculaceae bacterium]|nr:iron ABC transporter permease [Muribaculaceae bacterium]
MRRHTIVTLTLLLVIAAALPCGLLVGGVGLLASDVFGVFGGSGDSLASFIVLETRLPALLCSLIAGASLALAGLLMQTCFNNPLAGPSIMGISSGASVGVAVVIMLMGGAIGLWGRLAIVGGALVGALCILGVLLLFSLVVKSDEVLLIVGILLGYAASSAISLLNFFSSEQSVHSFVLWGLGSFSGLTLDEVPLFTLLCIAPAVISMLYAKSLNAMLFGERFAENVGVATHRVRSVVLLLSGLLTAVVTAWCGPIGFIGLIAPHIARMLLASSNHHILMPVTMLCGAVIGIICQIISVCPSLSTGSVIPVNAITPLIGVPIIVYVLLNRRKLLYFN